MPAFNACGKRGYCSFMTSIAGLIIVLLTVVDLISDLFDSVKSIFGLY